MTGPQRITMIHIFVDHSNIWGGARGASRLREPKTPEMSARVSIRHLNRILSATLLTFVVAVTAAYFAYLAVPRPVMYVPMFQLAVDLSRQEVIFQSQINNGGPAPADVLIETLGYSMASARPEYRSERHFPGAKWHLVLPEGNLPASAAFALSDSDAFLLGNKKIEAELKFRFRPAFFGGLVFGDTLTVRYECTPRENLQKPYLHAYYGGICQPV